MKLNSYDILEQLVAFKSITPDAAGSVNYIEILINNMGGRCQYINRNQTKNLIATVGNGSQIFAFAGHVDVVPSGEYSKWKSGNPFSLAKFGDELIGRGVADMKGSIAAFLVALQNFIQNSKNNNYQILLLLTSDEEGSAVDGTPLMVEYLQKKGIKLNYCLVGEPSCTNILGDAIKVGRRGSLTGRVNVIGKQGHIAYPHLCCNPIHEFAPALAELVNFQWDNGNEFFPATSLQFANIKSGLGVTNVIPGELSVDFNFRYNTLHTVSDLQQQVERILKKYHLNYTINWEHSAKPFLTKVGRLVDASSQAIHSVCGVYPESKTDGGTSDGRFLVDVSDEIIEFGLCNGSIHQINESTTMHDLSCLSNIYQLILENLYISTII